jgi:hypothetical protein
MARRFEATPRPNHNRYRNHNKSLIRKRAFFFEITARRSCWFAYYIASPQAIDAEGSGPLSMPPKDWSGPLALRQDLCQAVVVSLAHFSLLLRRPLQIRRYLFASLKLSQSRGFESPHLFGVRRDHLLQLFVRRLGDNSRNMVLVHCDLALLTRFREPGDSASLLPPQRA